jgi:hypothetical protein
MKYDGKEVAKRVMQIMKAKYRLEGKRDLFFDLDSFLILKKGNFFKHLYTWELLDFANKSYLLSISNSYRIEEEGFNWDLKRTTELINRYNAVLILTSLNFRNMIIRPKKFKEKIANLFLSFDVKLKNNPNFNKKYILESNAKVEKLELFLTNRIVSRLNLLENFNLEIINSAILMRFDNALNIEDSMQLIEIAKLIDDEIQNIKF